MQEDDYLPLYQTWSFTQPRRRTPSSSSVAPPAAAPSSRVASHDKTFRELVQRARIERRLPLATLASHVECEVETLAAFERGDEVLPPSTVEKLERVLGEAVRRF